MTPSSFFSPAPLPADAPFEPGAAPPAAAPPSPEGAADLYICSASLCEAAVRRSRALSMVRFSFDSKAFLAQVAQKLGNPKPVPEILQACVGGALDVLRPEAG